jgi:SulP family sulfate permease
MSNEFKGLDATEKAGFEAALNRDRRRAAQIASELRKKKPEHFVDKLAPADLGDFLDRLQSTIETGLKDLFGGAISGIVSIVYCVSYAAFIFSGPLAPWLGYGIAATFISTTIGALVVALRSSLPFTIAGPDSSTSVVTATLVAAFVEWLLANGAADHVLEPALLLMALSAVLVGILLCGLGLARAGRAIRFVPYPVIGGFLGATGWLMVSGASQVITDIRLAAANIHALLSPASLSKLTAAAAIAVSLYFGLRRFGNPLVLLGLILAGIAAAHLTFFATGMSLTDAQTAGWLFKPEAAVSLTLPWNFDELSRFPWSGLSHLSGDIIAMMFVTVMSVLLNTSGIELESRHEADLERELNAVGSANLLSASLGGYVTCTSLSRTTLNYEVGGRGRLSGLTVAAISGLVLAAGSGFLAYVPKFVLGGLLLYSGLYLLYRWLLDSWRYLSRVEYLSLAAIALIIIEWGFIAGVLIGIVAGLATFALSVSRVHAIKFSFDGSEYHSSLDRRSDELALLTEYGREVQGMFLHSYLFFGSANRLHQHVKALLAKQKCCFLLFDFRLVTGIDSSAIFSFTQIKQVADQCGARMIFACLTRDVENAFRAARFIPDQIIVAPNLDAALESCENAIIKAHQTHTREADTLHEWFAEALGGAEKADQLIQYCKRIEVQPDEIIVREGDPASSMHFILDGRIGIMVNGGSAPVRVRSLGPHTTIGEMGLITRQPRSATMQAELVSVLYELSANAYEHIKRENPGLSHALLTYIITVMAERLSFANRAIGLLQR